MATVAPELRGVVQLGPGLTVRGGVSAVERLIVEHVGPYVSVRHVATMEDGPIGLKLRVFLKAVLELRRALATSEPVIVHIHFASKGSTLRKTIFAWMALRAGKPLVLHAHGASFDQFFEGLPRFAQRLLMRTFARADRFVVLSTQWKDFYMRRCGLPEDRIAVLTNPTPLPTTLPDRRGRSHVQFLFLGRIGARKGSFDLLRAFRALPEALRGRARLVLAGDGQVEELRAAARDLGPQVTVHSWIDAAQRDALLNESDVFVLPSYNEGVPMALLEAMAHGLPVIATPVGGIPDAVTPDIEGFLLQPGDQAALTGALARFIEDEDLRLRCGRAARARAEHFDVAGYTQQLLQLYRQLLAEAGTRRMP
jgi:glycosyltransferase involved in cell wall biosynthesis